MARWALPSSLVVILQVLACAATSIDPTPVRFAAALAIDHNNNPAVDPANNVNNNHDALQRAHKTQYYSLNQTTHVGMNDVGATSKAPLETTYYVIGISGGSISSGHMVLPHERYSALLGSLLENAVVVNKAVAATRSILPSFCLDTLFTTHLDVLVLEFATNDCTDRDNAKPTSLTQGPILSATESMERLVRRLKLLHPRTRVIILYVCGPRSCHKCNGLYSGVAALYGITEVRLSDAIGRPEFPAFRFSDGVHPDPNGHLAIARLLAPVIASLCTALPVAPRRLPEPITQFDSSRDRIKDPWSCAMCEPVATGPEACNSLTPLFALNFNIQQARGKWGWVSTAPYSKLVFELPGEGALLLAFLCSHGHHNNIGNCTVRLRFSDRPDLPHYHEFKPGLNWALESSQQCVFFAGNYKPGSRVVITSDDAGLVKLAGLYTQQQ